MNGRMEIFNNNKYLNPKIPLSYISIDWQVKNGHLFIAHLVLNSVKNKEQSVTIGENEAINLLQVNYG